MIINITTFYSREYSKLEKHSIFTENVVCGESEKRKNKDRNLNFLKIVFQFQSEIV